MKEKIITFFKQHGFAMYLGIAVTAFAHFGVTNWQFYAICIPTILLVNFRGESTPQGERMFRELIVKIKSKAVDLYSSLINQRQSTTQSPIDKDILTMTREEFERIPHRAWGQEIDSFVSLVIVPKQTPKWQLFKRKVVIFFNQKFRNRVYADYELRDPSLHDSGFRGMRFVAVDEHNRPICSMGGCSDVIHINGIGGFGIRVDRDSFTNAITTGLTPITAWSIDCLPKSGLLRLFCYSKLKAGMDLSSFEIFSTGESRRGHVEEEQDDEPTQEPTPERRLRRRGEDGSANNKS